MVKPEDNVALVDPIRSNDKSNDKKDSKGKTKDSKQDEELVRIYLNYR